ncbi:hypothetical protein MC885_009501, partial [Smutsia gigantea]
FRDCETGPHLAEEAGSPALPSPARNSPCPGSALPGPGRALRPRARTASAGAWAWDPLAGGPRGGARRPGGPDAPPRSEPEWALLLRASEGSGPRRRRRPMARPRAWLLRLRVAVRSLLFWSLVYCYGGLCASIYLLKLLWSIGKGPAQTFRRVAREHPPACLNEPSLGTHCYVRIKDSGLRFHYVAAGERGRPLMLLLHGFPEFWYSWRHQLREFKSEYRVVALDLRGYGETDAPIHRDSYKLDCLITDIKDILDSLG